jgi:NitT/TauT family transport system substrate-binding protein
MSRVRIPRLYLLLTLILLLSGGGYFAITFMEKEQAVSKDNDNRPHKKLVLAVAPNIAWMPWYLAQEEGLFKEYTSKHNLELQFYSDTYQNTIDKFLMEDVDAIAISNIDAIAQIVRRDIEADVILITNESSGNEAILLPQNADTNVNSLRGKSFALVQYSTRHYLFDRYLIRNQIPFDEVNILDTMEDDIPDTLRNKEVYGVVTHNPNLYRLTHTGEAKVLFDSRQIPKEIFDSIVMRRETLFDYPEFAQILLMTWFSIMERLQGNKKGPTLDAMAKLAGLTAVEYEEQISTTLFNDTATKALSVVRDRRIRKTMRHIGYFIERHQLTGEEMFVGAISYPGRTPALLHFNGQPLQKFIAPPKNSKKY